MTAEQRSVSRPTSGASARGSPLAAAGRSLFACPPSPGSFAAKPRQSLLFTERAVLTEAAGSSEALRSPAAALEAQLRDELRPRLREASKAAAAPRRRAEELTDALEALAAARCLATEQVGQLAKRQLSEIRQMMRSPPDAVKRTLAAAWLLLNCERFRSSKAASAIRFDETADWPRCQRMLADEGFVNVVLSFDPRRLDDAPFVPLHV
ncbi:unnamed protein product, partial [Polarella glacialis]